MVEKIYYHMFPKKEKHTITVLNNFQKIQLIKPENSMQLVRKLKINN